jgi:hypothetical protein
VHFCNGNYCEIIILYCLLASCNVNLSLGAIPLCSCTKISALKITAGFSHIYSFSRKLNPQLSSFLFEFFCWGLKVCGLIVQWTNSLKVNSSLIAWGLTMMTSGLGTYTFPILTLYNHLRQGLRTRRSWQGRI